MAIIIGALIGGLMLESGGIGLGFLGLIIGGIVGKIFRYWVIVPMVAIVTIRFILMNGSAMPPTTATLFAIVVVAVITVLFYGTTLFLGVDNSGSGMTSESTCFSCKHYNNGNCRTLLGYLDASYGYGDEYSNLAINCNRYSNHK